MVARVQTPLRGDRRWLRKVPDEQFPEPAPPGFITYVYANFDERRVAPTVRPGFRSGCRLLEHRGSEALVEYLAPLPTPGFPFPGDKPQVPGVRLMREGEVPVYSSSHERGTREPAWYAGGEGCLVLLVVVAASVAAAWFLLR